MSIEGPSVMTMIHHQESNENDATNFRWVRLPAKAKKQQHSWEDRILQFVQHTAVEDRTVRYQKYRNVFIGSETVDSFLYHDLVKTRREAVIVGRILMRDYKLFYHVPIHGQAQQDFRDDDSLFYRFDHSVLQEFAACNDVSNYDAMEGSISTSTSATAAGDVSPPHAHVSSSAVGTATAAVPATTPTPLPATTAATTAESAIVNSLSMAPLYLSMTHPSSSPSATIPTNRRGDDDESLYQRAQDFMRVATVRDRYYHMRKYPKVFVGSEVVTALVDQGICPTRTDAVQLGRQLERELCLFHHVVNEHRFADEWYFYRYHPNHRLRIMFLKQSQASKQPTNQQGVVKSAGGGVPAAAVVS
jgi:hypothetical protein